MHNLRMDKSIRIVCADKGNLTVVLKNDDFFSKLESLIDSWSNIQIKKDPTKSLDTKLNKLLQSLADKKVSSNLSDSEIKVLILSCEDLWKYKRSDLSTPHLYGLIKAHKVEDGMPLREISNSVDSPGHNLVKKISKCFNR